MVFLILYVYVNVNIMDFDTGIENIDENEEASCIYWNLLYLYSKPNEC